MKPGDPGAGAAGRTTVLVVDDEDPLLEVMRECLAAEFEVETATSAAEAEMLMGLRPIKVIICDHLMPGELGLDFLVRMRERYPATKRILLTGYTNPELLSRSTTIAGLSSCLLKPAGAAVLVQAVKLATAPENVA